jgi:hypothetical protein
LASSEYDSSNDRGSESGPGFLESAEPFLTQMHALLPATRRNEVVCMDFKGSFECGNGECCDTFTVTDVFNRFVLYLPTVFQ